MKIVHICNDSRSSVGITQGLMHFFDDIVVSSDYMSYGKVILSAGDVRNAIKVADLIFISDLDGESYKTHLDKLNLWKKVIHYDYRDTVEIDTEMVAKSKMSFKRSQVNPDKKIIGKLPPILHCALDEYYVTNDKSYDVGCFFDQDQLSQRRNNILAAAKNREYVNSLIGLSTGKKQVARLAYRQQSSCFTEFLDLQSRCKVVLTAQPSHCEGDNRTWEAFASGALVVMDKYYYPHQNLPEDGKHCLVYDASNKDSIDSVLDRVDWYLRDDRWRSVAKAGYQFVLDNHRPKNRVAMMLRGCLRMV